VKAKGIFISTLLVIDTFFISYAVGFNIHPVLIVDPSLPPVVTKPPEKAKPATTNSSPAKKATEKTAEKAPETKPAPTKAKDDAAKAKAKSAKHGSHHTTH
jgi:hypothetical protein